MELLPSGECAIEDVAAKLGYSKRSLQRKLQEENTSFQKQLNHTRELLTKYYVGSTDMRAEDIAYLLGCQDTGSFLRAWIPASAGEFCEGCFRDLGFQRILGSRRIVTGGFFRTIGCFSPAGVVG